MSEPTRARLAPRRRTSTEVSRWAERLPDAFLLCRDLGHVWNPYRAWEDRAARKYVQVLRCTRCKAERTRDLDYRGNRLTQSYAYEDDYLAPAGSGVLSSAGRADLRLTSLLRLVATNDNAPADSPDVDEVASRRQRRRKAS